MRVQTAKGDELGNDMKYLEAPGTYHLVIDEVKEGLNSKDEPLDGTTLAMTVLGGDVAGQEKKKTSVTVWDIDGSKALEDQKMTVRVITAFLVATNLVRDSSLLGSEIEVDPQQAVGSQVVVKLAKPSKRANGKWVEDKDSKFLQISFDDFYHVDDPAVKSVPKNQEALKMLGEDQRHPAEWFDFKKKDGTAAPASAAASDYDDI